MLSSRLETAIDMNFVQFNYENDKKKRENEVSHIQKLTNDNRETEIKININ